MNLPLRPRAIMALYNLPEETAIDIVETQPSGKLRRLLEVVGYVYRHQQHQWQMLLPLNINRTCLVGHETDCKWFAVLNNLKAVHTNPE
jgi:hypothetical protein